MTNNGGDSTIGSLLLAVTILLVATVVLAVVIL